MTRFFLTLVAALVSACILCACGGGEDAPTCEHPFVGPTQSGEPFCPATQPDTQPGGQVDALSDELIEELAAEQDAEQDDE